MKRAVSLAAIAVIAFGLTACDNAGDQMASNGKICANWKTTAAPTTATVAGVVPVGVDAATPVDVCVKHWAYSLASSRDAADVVADAAVAACATSLSNWNQTALNTAAPGGPSASDQTISTVTGQPTNAMAEHADFARSQALLYVVEARAGRCKPPAIVNGVPVGA
jgi:hypothetical protein